MGEFCARTWRYVTGGLILAWPRAGWRCSKLPDLMRPARPVCLPGEQVLTARWTPPALMAPIPPPGSGCSLPGLL